MKIKKGCLTAFGVILIGIGAIVAAAVWFIDSRYDAIFAAPQFDHLSVTALHPAMRLAIDPSQASSQIRDIVSETFPRPVPAWIIDRALPYRASIILAPNLKTDLIDGNFLLNTRRFDSVIINVVNGADIPKKYPDITWNPNGMAAFARGALTLDASFPIDENAKEDAFYQWNRNLSTVPLPLEGGHFIEAVADNREGAAYVVFASLLKLYDYDLEKEAKDVSLTSFQFVTKARLTGDLVKGNAMRARLTIEVIEEHKNKLAVLNVKAFLDDQFERMSNDFKEYHDIAFAGTSRWENNVMVFEYELSDARKTIQLIMDGQLFKK